ncbi:hypothetical protein A2610_02090 [Candidatus Wolfebacteria bacterium RIFOXYD1_FULL_48_65]|uniref:Uncharacterized protein n=1 Tax=Candidatus Wolfebacteria bacterium RIFOXYD1_FULL_48_65 TaxID=1802561 RepID=A0A1F8E250_9BACT|nr:MAG: hypothetical protein A2610_02090 [Candidatus Wolfebacteria bacterium RIFOXYD1_FULL_48_65]
MKSSRQTIFSTVLSIVITVFAVGMVVHAAPWADPTATPPGNNAAEPINISNSGQAKSGGLMLNTGGALIGLIVQNGSMGIGDVTPDAGLKLDVEGKVGATEYCDQNGNNCRAMTAVAAEGGSFKGGFGGHGSNPPLVRCDSPNSFTGNCTCPTGTTYHRIGLSWSGDPSTPDTSYLCY